MRPALEKAGETDALLEVLGEVAAADPSDIEVRAGLALAYVGRGDLDKARDYLSAETAGSNPALWLTLAEIELRGNRLPEGKHAVIQAITLDRSQAQTAVVLGCRLAEAIPKAAIRRSTPSPMRRSPRTTSPRRRSRCTSSRRASARTSSR